MSMSANRYDVYHRSDPAAHDFAANNRALLMVHQIEPIGRKQQRTSQLPASGEQSGPVPFPSGAQTGSIAPDSHHGYAVTSFAV